MAVKANIIKSNFTGGEIDPLLYGRVDTPRYQNGCEKILNAFVLSTGGCTRRSGTKFVANAGQGITVRLIPFMILKKDVTPPITQGYVIEFRSDNKIRFYTNSAQIQSAGNPYELSSPFTNADLSKIRFAQFDNVLYLVHPDFAPQKLVRTNDTSWTISAVSFKTPASKSVSSLTRSGQAATAVTTTAHEFETGDKVTISGAAQPEYNGTFTVSRKDDVTFEYTVTGAPATPATGTITAINSWTLPWKASNGYPGAITFFEQRMILAGTKANPHTVWGSKTGEIDNFITRTGDSDPFAFTLVAATAPILHLISPSRQIVVLTGSEEILIQGSSDKALTPTNVQIRPQTGYGTIEPIQPMSINSEILFTTKYGKKLRLFGYKFDVDSYTAPEQSLIAAHMLSSGIVGMAQQIEANSIIWLATQDGKFVSVSFDKDQEVVAWSQNSTDGAVKGITVIPFTAQDQIWIAVQRNIGGINYTYIEYLDPLLNTDCAYTGTDANGKAMWTGLSHLEGKTVDILADGIVMPQQTVQSGQITLPRNAKAVEIGLHYDSEIEDLPVAIQTAVGISRGMAVSVNEILVLLHNSVGCEINGEVVPFRKFGTGVLDKPVTPFTGLKKVNNIGWDEGKITIKQTQPLPFTVLAIIKKVTAND